MNSQSQRVSLCAPLYYANHNERRSSHKLPQAALLKAKTAGGCEFGKAPTCCQSQVMLPGSTCGFCPPPSASCQSVLSALPLPALLHQTWINSPVSRHPFNKTTLHCSKPSMSESWVLWNKLILSLSTNTDLTLSPTCPFLNSRNFAARRLLGTLSLVKQRCVKLSRQSRGFSSRGNVGLFDSTSNHNTLHVFPVVWEKRDFHNRCKRKKLTAVTIHKNNYLVLFKLLCRTPSSNLLALILCEAAQQHTAVVMQWQVNRDRCYNPPCFFRMHQLFLCFSLFHFFSLYLLGRKVTNNHQNFCLSRIIPA